MRKTKEMAKFDGVFQLDERGFEGGEKLRNGTHTWRLPRRCVNLEGENYQLQNLQLVFVFSVAEY